MSVRIDIQNLPKELRREGLEEELIEICRKNDIVFMAIFGSFVRGEQKRKSDIDIDIDIAIEFERNSEKSLFDLVRIENELRKVFKRKVDLEIFSSLSPYIIEDVKREMRIIYEKR
jgi:predicted nucleotidyltransferase